MLHNAATEPEVVEFALFLKRMGAIAPTQAGPPTRAGADGDRDGPRRHRAVPLLGLLALLFGRRPGANSAKAVRRVDG